MLSGNNMNVHMIGLGIMWAFLFVHDQAAAAKSSAETVGKLNSTDVGGACNPRTGAALDFWSMASGRRLQKNSIASGYRALRARLSSRGLCV